MKAKPYRNFLLGMGAMIFLSIAAAHARQLGAVQFANGSTTPTSISKALLSQAKSATSKPGQVVLLRAGASPVGGAAYNFVLSGERAASVRNALVKFGVPRKKVVSQYVGIVNRGSAAQDRTVIIDATTRAALGLASPTGQGQQAALRRLEAQVSALEAAAHKVASKPMPKAVPSKAKARPFYKGGAWYATRTVQFNNGGIVGASYADVYGPIGTGGIAGAAMQAGDNYQERGYGFELRTRRPTVFNFWTPYQIPLDFSMGGLSQAMQVTNPVLQGTQGVTILPDGVLFYPVNARDSVSTQFLHASIKSPWTVYGLTVTPGLKVGWLGEQSLSGGETTQPMYAGCTPSTNGGYPCPTITTATTQAVGGSAISVTPSLSVAGQGWKVGYSQSPWGAQGYAAPRVLMGTVAGRGVSLALGAAFPDCPMCSANGAAITTGKIVKVGVRGDGWGGSVMWVGGEQFQADGMTMPGTLMQALAPYNPNRPWNSYNPGLTISLTKRLARGLWVEATYGLDHQSGAGYGANIPVIPLYTGSSTPTVLPTPGPATTVTKTEELSIHGRF